QIGQTSSVAILPQTVHSRTFSATAATASASGSSNTSRRRTIASTARLAERGPSPGSLAIRAISRSISGPAPAFTTGNAVCSEGQLHAGRQREPFGDLGEFLLGPRLRSFRRLLDRGDDQVLDHLALLGLEERGIDREPAQLALGRGHRLHEAGARLALDLDRVELLLHLGHLGLHLLRLTHELAHVAKAPQPLQHRPTTPLQRDRRDPSRRPDNPPKPPPHRARRRFLPHRHAGARCGFPPRERPPSPPVPADGRAPRPRGSSARRRGARPPSPRPRNSPPTRPSACRATARAELGRAS